MFKDYKTICIAIICFVMLGTVITGCHQQEKNEPPISKEPIQETVIPDSPQKENLTDEIKLEPISDTANTDTISNDEQKQEVSEVQFAFYPSGANFIASIINKRGNVEITDEMRERFNLFARDYRWVYMPDMDGYESFFETTHYVDSYGHNNFADAVFYVLHYLKCPEKMSAEAMQNAIQSLFVAKDSYGEMPHQAYFKFANYEDSYYSPWPEGGLDHDRMFYLLTGLDVVQEGSNDVYITIRTKDYYFNDPGYEPGANEKWLAEKPKELGIPDMQAAAKLIASGEIEEIEGRYEFETIIYINNSEENPHGINPIFVSSRSRDIEYDEPFLNKK